MKNYLNVEDLPIDELSKVGVTVDRLEKTKNLDRILNLEKTSLLNISGEFNKVSFKADAKLSLYCDKDKNYHVKLHFIKKYPDLNAPIYGTFLNKEQRDNLLNTGHAGTPITIKKLTGEKIEMLVSLDKDTNQISAFAKSSIKLPDNLLGVALSPAMKDELINGKSLLIENMQKSDGTFFTTRVQFDADKRHLIFINDKKDKKESKAVAKEVKESPAEKRKTTRTKTQKI